MVASSIDPFLVLGLSEEFRGAIFEDPVGLL